MATNSIPQRRCIHCKIEKPRTLEYFGVERRKKDGMSYVCKECLRIEARERAQKRRQDPEYRELENARVKNSRDKDRAKYNETQREYYAEWIERPGKRDAKNNRQRHNHQIRCIHVVGYRERLSKLSLAYHHKRKVDIEYRRQKSALKHKRRSLIDKSVEHFTYQDEVAQYVMQKGKCWWCGKPVAQDEYEVDHITPISRGRSNSPRNIVIAHVRCNRSKSNKMAWEWVGRLI